MWSGLWQKHARYRETNVAIAYEQQGFFEQAQGAYEVAMSKVHNDYSSSPAPGSVRSELRLWEEHWIRQVICTLLNYEVVMSVAFFALWGITSVQSLLEIQRGRIYNTEGL
jgi:hypothetical protein